MKIVAHRGWSIGEQENTIESFKKSFEKENVDGVEIDLRKSKCGTDIIISHDLTDREDVLTFEKGLEYLKDKNLELFIELKEYEDIFIDKIIDLLEKYSLKDKSVLFAFEDVAEKFDWENRRVRLGIITLYPWDIEKDINKYKPDFILMGWDYRWWTKYAFKLIWSFYSIPKICQKYKDIHFVVGIAGSKRDYDWIKKQNGLYCCTADKPLV